MSSLTVGAMMAFALLQQTDTTVALDGATRLSVETPGGSISVTAWERPDVRIRATHSSRSYVEVDRRGRTLSVEAEGRRGPATIVDFEISAPASVDLDLEGMYTSITVTGMNGEVSAESVQGDIRVQGGRGQVKVSSVGGEIVVEGANGRVDVESVSKGVRITDTAGEVYVEGVGGSLTMSGMRARVVDVGTVGGRITFDGEILDGGQYYFGSHGGSIDISVPGTVSASVTVAALMGGLTSNLPGAPTRLERGKRTTFTVGSGAAQIEVETFSGRVSINRR